MKNIFKRILSNNSINKFKQNFPTSQATERQIFCINFPQRKHAHKRFQTCKIQNNLKMYLTLTLLHKNWWNLKKGESETLKFPKIFYESILSKEIKIGEYSNKNFISVISSLSEFPDLIKNLFIFYKKTTRRKYHKKILKIWYKEKKEWWEIIKLYLYWK